MPCETAFRVIARRCLADVAANHRATCGGDRAALHEMRVALTRLRAAVAFFSPMAADPEWIRLKRELKWLNAHLGAARDMDVAIERLEQPQQRQPAAIADYRAWKKNAADSHRRLARALRSERYRRLIKATSDWVENAPWPMHRQETKQLASGITDYCTRKLARWHQKLLKKSRRLDDMDAEERHQLRLANKRLRYAIEFFTGLLPDKKSSMHDTLKHLRRAQEALGELNDAFKSQTLLTSLEPNAGANGDYSRFLDSARDERLMRTATRAYRKIAGLNPGWT